MRACRRLLLYALYLYALHLPLICKVGTAAPLTREALASAGVPAEISRGARYPPAYGFHWEPKVENGSEVVVLSPEEEKDIWESEVRRMLEVDVSVRQSFGSPSVAIRGQRSTFGIKYLSGSMPAGAKRAFEYAARKWADIFATRPTIRVSVDWKPLRVKTLGITESRFVPRDQLHPSLQPNTMYGVAVALALTNQDNFISGNEAHIRMVLNSNTPWHYDTRTNAPGNRWDLATVAMHELAHGLFFSGVVHTAGATAFYPGNPARPSRFDRFVTATAGGAVDKSCTNSRALYSALTEPGLRFINPSTNTNYSLYAPITYRPGSSTYHLDDKRYKGDCIRAGVPLNRCSDLMTPQLQNGYTQRTIGDNTLSVLRAMLSDSEGMNSGSCQRGLVDPVPVDDSSSGFALPRWVIYVLIGVGVLGIVSFLVSLAACFKGKSRTRGQGERERRRRHERRYRDGPPPPPLSPPPPAYRRSEEPVF